MKVILDEEKKKEPVLNVRIVEEPVYGVTQGAKKEDIYMSTYTQSQKIEVLLRGIQLSLILILVVLCIIVFLMMNGFGVFLDNEPWIYWK
ncbi:MAG: hypothetical protein VXY89_15635 [SAR324 cluster bacterium]|nr:hypothetical protein [SAR324 cluster bacterium]